MIKKYFTEFSEWMNYNPPYAMSFEGWKSFNEEFEAKAPVRFWLSKIFMGYLHRIYFKFEKMYDFVKYRTWDKYHLVKTGLKPDYYAFDVRMMFSCFSLLQDYVEVKLARDYAFHTHKKIYSKFSFRSPEYGLLQLGILTSNPSDEEYKEVLEIYKWWIQHKELVIDKWDYYSDNYDLYEEMLIRLIKVKRYIW